MDSDENCVTRRRGGDYVAEVQLEEVGIADYGICVDVADYRLPDVLVGWLGANGRGGIRG